MIDQKQLERIIQTFQSNRINVYREYAQHLFLSAFYRKEGSEKILFKGGTALRMVYKSPRFSEDLDFSGSEINPKEIEDILTDVLADLGRENLICKIEEAKTTSGGYLANFSGLIHNEMISIAIQISLRRKRSREYQTLPVVNEYLPTYTVNVLPLEELTNEKIQAALTRGKPRDFFDIYFFLREGLFPKKRIRDLGKIKEIVLAKGIDFRKEIALFLPLSMRSFIKSFPKPLLEEIERFR